MSTTRATFLTAVLTAALDVQAANLITNPGFETGDFTDWMVTGTSTSYGVATDATAIAAASAVFFQPNFVNVRTGSYAGFAVICCSTSGTGPLEFLHLSQTINVPQNTLMSVGFSLGNDSARAFGVNSPAADPLALLGIYIDGVRLTNLSPGANDIYGFAAIPRGSTPAEFTDFAASFNTGQRNSVSVMFAFAGSGTARVGASFDDLFAEPVPEPSTFVLLLSGIASVAYVAQRRHKREAWGAEQTTTGQQTPKKV